MNKVITGRGAIHVLLFFIELSILFFIIGYHIVPKLTPPEWAFPSGTQKFSFRLTTGQEQLLANISRIRVYYATSSDQVLSERQKQTLEEMPFKAGEYTFDLPARLGDFRLDFNWKNRATPQSIPPQISCVTLNGKELEDGELEAFISEKLGFSGYIRIYKLPLRGWGLVVIPVGLLLAIILTAILYCFCKKNAGGS